MGSRQRRFFLSIAYDYVIGLVFCHGTIIADHRIGISPFADGDVLAQYLYMAGIGNGTVEPIQVVKLYFLRSRRFYLVADAHDLRMGRIFCLVGTADDQGGTACAFSNPIHQSFLHFCDRIKMLTVCRGIKIAAGAFDTISCTHDDGTIAVRHFIGSTCNHISDTAAAASFHGFIGIEGTDNRGKRIFRCVAQGITAIFCFILTALHIIAADGRSKTTARIGIAAQRGRRYSKLPQLVSRGITDGNLVYFQGMGADFNSSCAGIRIRPYGNGFRQILFCMIVIMDVHAKETLMDFFSEGKHRFLGPAADKDFGILADGDIGPVVGRADIVSNGLGPFLHNIFFCRHGRAGHTRRQDSRRQEDIPSFYDSFYRYPVLDPFLLDFLCKVCFHKFLLCKRFDFLIFLFYRMDMISYFSLIIIYR